MPIFTSPLMDVKQEWTDYNGHLNMAYYGVLFDLGLEFFNTGIDLAEAYMRRTAHTTYSAEFRIRYLREVHAGAKVSATTHVLDVGPKAFHFCQELIHEDGWIAATGEGISLHIDQSGPRVAAYPPEQFARLQAAAADHGARPVPDWVGAPMRLRK
ncbi:thioesterase [Pseudooceanicola sediminis]|uniref:Thioesterase n=1 Tax=Pseudooceanicola sediminis TaxID=2211117 RepID=A0A399J3E2_9RHOB|nr:thioesterase family protein [Pseudooceanicola sediminis]KAA2316216.1 thioesterase [Puniceibacterium sp. HSS470]RII39127.1 thioesterase [Pseudooceanicola sediminis]|tara:strand:- start:42095 stop:42562 length:468 start_codon:yes stop_codon:yes gene_type:complete